MATVTTHYKIEILKTGTTLKVTYRGASFSKVERLKGLINDSTLAAIGRIIPPRVKSVPEWQKKYASDLKITPIQKGNTSQYSMFRDAWFSFYETYSGLPPKFSGADGNALKQIITYLNGICGDAGESLVVWSTVLQNWKNLSEFHRQHTDLKYINSNLNKILNAIKEGNSDSGHVFASAMESELGKSFKFK